MASGQEEVLSYTPAKKKKEPEEVLSYTPANSRSALNNLNFSAMPGMMPGKIPGNPDIIKGTLSGIGRDVKQSFSRNNPLLGPAVDEFKQDPTKLVTGLPQAALSTAGDLVGGAAGLVQKFSQAIPRIMAGENVLEAIGMGKYDQEAVSGAPRKLIENITGQKAEASQAVINAAMSPLTGTLATADAGINELAKLVTKDENKREGIRSVGQVAAFLVLGKVARGIKGSAFSKEIVDRADKLFDRLKQEPPIGEDVTRKVPVAPLKRRVEISNAIPDKITDKIPVADIVKEPWELRPEEFNQEVYSGTAAITTKEGKLVKGWDHGDARNRAEELGFDVVGREETGKAAGWIKFGRFVKISDLENNVLHKNLVQKALTEGKPVPPEVLADYPSLRINPSRLQSPPEPTGNPIADAKAQADFSAAQTAKEAVRPPSPGISVTPPEPPIGGNEVGATYGEGGSIIGGVKSPPNVKPTIGPSTGKGPNAFFRLAEQNIKRIHPGLHRLLQRYRFERDSRAGQMNSQLAMVDHIMEKAMAEKTKGLDNIARDEVMHTRLADLAEGRLKPENALEELGMNVYKRMMDGVVQEISRLTTEQGEKFTVRGPWGERSWSPVEGYYPRVYSNLAELLESPAASGVRTREVIGHSLAKRMFPEKYANKATRAAAIEDALGVAKNFTSKTATKKYGHLEASRLLQPEDVMELEAEGILKREYNSGVIHDYINKVQDRLSWTRNFGSDVVWNGQKVPRAWAEGLSSVKGNTLAESFLKKSLERSTGARDVNAWTKLSDVLNVVQTPKMIMSSAANMWQWLGNTVPLQPFSDVPSTVFDTMKKIMGDKSLDKFYRESGIQITPERILSKIEDDPNVFIKSQKAFYKIIGFSGTEGTNSFYGGMAGANKAMSLSRKLFLKPESWRSGAWEQQLKALGVDDLSIAEIKTGKLVGPRNMEELQRAAWEVKQISQFSNDMWGKPLSFSNPNAKLLTKFKGFPISQTQKFAVDGVFKPAIEFVRTGGKLGDIGPLIKAPVTLGLAGAMTTGVKHLVWSFLGKKDMYDKYIKNKPFLQQWAYFISQAGSLGIATDFATATSADRLLTTAAGPTFSDGMTILKGIYTAWNSVGQAAWKTKSFRLIADRKNKIIKVLADTSSKMQPAVRMALARFWPEYGAAKDLNSWENIYSRASVDYKNLLEYGGPDAAEQYWDKVMNTWGEEYFEITGKFPDKPTIEETISYQENKKK